MIRTGLVLLFLTNCLALFAQKEIDLAAFQAKYKNDLGVVLNHTQTVTIAVNSKTGELDIFETDHEEILYLKNSARFYTEESISLSDFFESVVSINAMVIKADGKKVKLKEDDFKTVDSPPSSWVFHDDDKEIIFDFHELREGYRTVIEYTKKVKKPEFFDIFHFISGFPVEYAALKISFPQAVELNFYERAFTNSPIVKNEVTDKKGIRTVSWEYKNIPAFKSEEGSTNINNHIPHIVAQIKGYTVNGERKAVIGSVDELHAFYVEFLSQKEDESNRKEINDVTRSLIEGKETEYEKMDTIYKWVQTNIKYIAFEDGINGYVPRSCSEVMKNRYGDCKDMSNLLIEMLAFAGVKNAYVAWVGTNDIPYQMSEIPSPLTCNHVICVVEKPEGGYYYLDATGSEMGFLAPPSSIQEKEILVHKGPESYELYKVPAVDASKNYFRTRIEYTCTETDSIRGTGTDYLGGYERESRSYDLKNLDDEDLYDYVKDICLGGRNRFTLSNYELKNLDDNNAELQIDYTFSVDNLFIRYGSDYILNPVLFKPRITQFNHEDYKYDRSKEHHRTVDYEFRFTIPEGFQLKHLPENVTYNHNNMSFNADYRVEGNVIVVTMVYQYHMLVITPEMFDDWNTFSDQINAATSQTIILQKI
ncbi:MAG: DUF3857 and transglutaminase domain-containing protein [Bacteroidetes bacterium]|nr:DUF3857 and transglutaminase domain-containing protein [Bacteroidota bacterium]